MRELDDETGIGLIEKRRQGFGKVNVIYVKTFMPEKTDEKKFGEELEKFKKQTSVENEETAEVYNLNFMKSQNQTSRSQMCIRDSSCYDLTHDALKFCDFLF